MSEPTAPRDPTPGDPLEDLLRTAAREMDYPPTPPLARAVRARLQDAAARRADRWGWLPWRRRSTTEAGLDQMTRRAARGERGAATERGRGLAPPSRGSGLWWALPGAAAALAALAVVVWTGPRLGAMFSTAGASLAGGPSTGAVAQRPAASAPAAPAAPAPPPQAAGSASAPGSAATGANAPRSSVAGASPPSSAGAEAPAAAPALSPAGTSGGPGASGGAAPSAATIGEVAAGEPAANAPSAAARSPAGEVGRVAARPPSDSAALEAPAGARAAAESAASNAQDRTAPGPNERGLTGALGDAAATAAEVPLSLAEAAGRVGFTPLVPAALGEPDAVQGRDAAERPGLELVYGARAGFTAAPAGEPAVRLTERPARSPAPLAAGEPVAWDGVAGIWTARAQGSGGVLTWTQGGLELRLETALPREQALAIAASVAPRAD